MSATPDLVASLVQQEYEKLPAKRKPADRGNGLREWVPLSGIVAEGPNGKLTCLSLATGMKCLPSSQLPQANGNVLHDWHAETLAIRAFNRFVLDECLALANKTKQSSDFVRTRERSARMGSSSSSSSAEDDAWHGQPFAWREDVLLHMYCSEAPCGDASMELIMAAQADASPWAVPSSSQSQPPGVATDALPGRAYFSQLGIVRRKPARGDAPTCLSKSCSDKLSLKQCTSLLSALSSLLVSPENVYLQTLVLPKSQYSETGCRRAFSSSRFPSSDGGTNNDQRMSRMAPLASKSWGAGYAFREFEVKTTDLEFVFSRRPPNPNQRPLSSPSPSPSPELVPSNLSAAASLGVQHREESTLNGVLRGHKVSQASSRGASFASRRKMWDLAVEIVTALSLADQGYQEASDDVDDPSLPLLCSALGVTTATTTTTVDRGAEIVTYGDVKKCSLLGTRNRVKEDSRTLALKGWLRNLGDEDFTLPHSS